MRRFLVGGCAALLLAACSDDPSLFLGGPPGPATRVQMSHGNLVLATGASARVGATILDEVGNVTADAPAFSACTGAPVTVNSATGEALFSGAADIVASATSVGEGCVNVSGGGQSDTIHVTVAPSGIRINGDPFVGYDSQNPTANVFQFSADAFDGAGASLTGSLPYEWTSSNEALFFVDRFTGQVTTRGLGSATLRLVSPGGADHSRLLTIGATAFEGTASASTGGHGDLITLNRTGGPVFDADTEVYFAFGGVRAYFEGTPTADQATVVVPITGIAGRGDIVIRKMGPDQLDRRVVFSHNSGSVADRWSPGNEACGTAPDFDAIKSATNMVYLSFRGTGVAYGGTSPDDHFRIDGGAAGRTVDVRLEWLGSADADLFVRTSDCSANFVAPSQEYQPPEPPVEEILGVVIPAGTSVVVRVVNFADQGAAFTNARLRVQ